MQKKWRKRRLFNIGNTTNKPGGTEKPYEQDYLIIIIMKKGLVFLLMLFGMLYYANAQVNPHAIGF